MSNDNRLFDQFEKFNGSPKFVGFGSYLSKLTGEISNYVINCNIDVARIKLADFKKLKNCSDAIIEKVAKDNEIPVLIVKQALSELTISAEKNLSTDPTQRTVNSQAQTDAYVNINKSVRVCKTDLAVHIFGMVISKTVLVKGEYKTVNSSQKTIAKNKLKKALRLSSDKFRSFVFLNLDTVKVSGQKFVI